MDNPYDSPKADLTPTDWQVRRQRFKAWAKDRAAFWAVSSIFWMVFLIPAWMTSGFWFAVGLGIAVATMVLWELIAWVGRSLKRIGS